MTSFKKTTYLFLSLFFMSCCFSLYAEAQRVKGKRARKDNAELRTDSLQMDSLSLDSLAADSLMSDSLASDSTKKEPLDAPVIYEASDSIVFTKEAGGWRYSAMLFVFTSIVAYVCAFIGYCIALALGL